MRSASTTEATWRLDGKDDDDDDDDDGDGDDVDDDDEDTICK